jgi:nitrite reductase (NO-forming)
VSYQSTHADSTKPYWMVATMLLGLLVGVLGPFALLMWLDSHKARSGAASAPAATASDHTMAGHTMAEGMSMPTESFAGAAPANAADLAAAHKPYDARMPPGHSGNVAKVQLTLKNMTVQIAPGVKYNTWAFDGHGAPGPVIHVRQGQTVDMTLKNGGTIPHSIDFHAARIANGMYGAIVVDLAKPLPRADHEYVLVASEWYLSTDGITAPASLDMGKARAMTPDWMTFNGYASQYATHPLTAKPGETTRFYVVAAGPTMDTNFHVVGTLLNRAWGNADMTSYQRNVQTVAVPAGGGGVFDVKIDAPGLYPFVSHAFAHVDLGQVGVLKVGNVPGTMSH